MQKEVVLTGLRTNAEYHLGNYLGAIMPMVERAHNLAGKYQVNLFAPDLHSITTPVDYPDLYRQTMHNIKLFVAAGLPLSNPDVFVYRQSFIPAHSELTVLLSNFTSFGTLSRMTQFKDKSMQLKTSKTLANSPFGMTDSLQNDVHVTAGLFNYPILMAADILLYGAKYIPVGEDQSQHLEFTRDIAQRINNKFGEVFVVPATVEEQHQFVGKSQGTRIRSLRNPAVKMSKSIDDPAGTIQLSDSPKEATKKIMAATTDSFGKINFDYKKQPGISNLLQMLALLSGISQVDINKEWEGNTNYGELKHEVAIQVSKLLSELQIRLGSVNDKSLNDKLISSEASMNKVANKQLHKVQQVVGLRPV